MLDVIEKDPEHKQKNENIFTNITLDDFDNKYVCSES